MATTYSEKCDNYDIVYFYLNKEGIEMMEHHDKNIVFRVYM